MSNNERSVTTWGNVSVLDYTEPEVDDAQNSDEYKKFSGEPDALIKVPSIDSDISVIKAIVFGNKEVKEDEDL